MRQEVAQCAAGLTHRLIERDDTLLDGDEDCPRRHRLGDRRESLDTFDVTDCDDDLTALDDRGGHVGDRPLAREVEDRHPDRSGEVAEEFSDAEREVDALAGVEPRVAHGLVPMIEIGVGQFVATAEALGDVFTGQLDVDAAGPGALGAVRCDESADLATMSSKCRVLRPLPGCTCCRASGRTPTRPGGRRRTGAEERAQAIFDLVGTHPGDQRQTAGQARRVEHFTEFEHVLGARRGADLAADRVADAAEELDVRAVEIAGALADPEHVRRAVVPVARHRVAAGERFFVAEDQRFVGGVDVDLVRFALASVSMPQARMNVNARSISAATLS